MKKRTNYFAAWLGALAIALHALVPLAGMALYGPAAAAPVHEHGGHAHGADHAANEAPAAPEICVGDCPCCTSGYKTFVPSRIDLAWLLPSLSGDRTPPTALLSILPSETNHDHPARAPPTRS
ncbi:MAG TPA: hypothetical protein VFG44_10915 [Burkholderiales bacterium]|jgi:hypothetical protein|nr:hypothetical protein [Burkholderiales bacterium]